MDVNFPKQHRELFSLSSNQHKRRHIIITILYVSLNDCKSIDISKRFMSNTCSCDRKISVRYSFSDTRIVSKIPCSSNFCQIWERRIKRLFALTDCLFVPHNGSNIFQRNRRMNHKTVANRDSIVGNVFPPFGADRFKRFQH